MFPETKNSRYLRKVDTVTFTQTHSNVLLEGTEIQLVIHTTLSGMAFCFVIRKNIYVYCLCLIIFPKMSVTQERI